MEVQFPENSLKSHEINKSSDRRPGASEQPVGREISLIQKY